METKIDFKIITKEIREACLSLGYGQIILKAIDTPININISEDENILNVSIYINKIEIEYDVISIAQDNMNVITFDDITSIDKQIAVYETIYDHQEQLQYFELDWDDYFKAKRVMCENGAFIWRILSPDEARHLWYNSKGMELYQLYDDDSESMIESTETLDDCIQNNYDIGVAVY